MEYAAQTWRIFFEAIPVAIAFFTVILGTFKALTLTEPETQKSSWLFVLSAVLLIFAQSSWSWTLFVKNDILGTDFANVIWTVFNTVVMISMVYTIKGFKK